MTKNQKIWSAVIVILVIAMIGWRWYSLRGENKGVFTIGVAVAETGDAAEWGTGEYQVTKMLVDDFNAAGGLNGQPIGLDVEDTKSTGDGTVNAVIKLINIDHVPVIVGPTWVDSYQGPLPIAENAKVTMLTPSAAVESIPDKGKWTYLFTTFWPQAPQIETTDNFMVSQGIKTLAIINDHDPFDTQLADSLEKEAQTKGITIIDREQLPIDQNDFRTEILKIKQFHPDALFIEINNVAGLGPFMKQVKELGLTARIFTSPDAQNQDAVSKFGTFMEGMTYPFLVSPTGTSYENFVNEYQTKYGTLPSGPSVIPAYNAITALIAVLKGGARTGTEVRDALRNVNVPGLGVSSVSFNESGQIKEADFQMKMIHNGQFVVIPNQ